MTTEIKPLDAEALRKVLERILTSVGYAETAAMMQVKESDLGDDIEGAQMIEFIYRAGGGPYLTIYQVLGDDGRPAWALEGYKTIHNYPHEPDGCEEFTIAQSPSEHVIAEALARYEFDQRLIAAQDAIAEEKMYQEWKAGQQ